VTVRTGGPTRPAAYAGAENWANPDRTYVIPPAGPDPSFGLPARSVTAPASTDATTVPPAVIPATVTAKCWWSPPSVTLATAPAAVEPPRSTLDPSNPTTGSLNATSNRTTGTAVGSGWPAVTVTVTVGATLSNVTAASAPVAARLPFPAASVTAPATTPTTTVPEPVMPATVTR